MGGALGQGLASRRGDDDDGRAEARVWRRLRLGPEDLRLQAVDALAHLARGVAPLHLTLSRSRGLRRAEWSVVDDSSAQAEPPASRAKGGTASAVESQGKLPLHEAAARIARALPEAEPVAAQQQASSLAMRGIAEAYGGASGTSARKRDVRQVKGFSGMLARGELTHLMPVAKLIGSSVEFVGLADATRVGYWASVRTTEEYLSQCGHRDTKEWTFERLSGFCVLFVLAGYKAKSLGNYLAAWRYCAKLEEYQLADADYARLQSVKKALIKITDQGDRDYAFPWLFEFTYRYAQVVTANAKARGELVALEDVQFLAGAALRGGTGARAGSSFGKELTEANGKVFKLRKDGVVWSAGSGQQRFVSVRIPKGKSALRWVHFEDDPANDHCTYRLLRNWFERSKMASRASTDPFFPRIVGGELDWKVEQSPEQFLAKARLVATFLRLPADWVVRIRGHSWRAGFATDMLSRNVEVWKVKLMGGWKSECVLLYARITMATMAKWTTEIQSRTSELALLAELPDVSLYLEEEFVDLFNRSSAHVPAGTERPSDLPTWTAAGAGRPLVGPTQEDSALPSGVDAASQVRPPPFASLEAAIQR